MNRYTVTVATYMDCPIDAADDNVAWVIAQNMVAVGRVPVGSESRGSVVASVRTEDGRTLLNLPVGDHD